ncbi:MAG: hypothetical protein, partial [Olavius algarvensis Gamma 1 endosymbiont]
RNSLTVGSLKKINNLFIKDIFHGYCLKRQSLRTASESNGNAEVSTMPSKRKLHPPEFKAKVSLVAIKGQSVAVLGMRNGTSQSPFRPALGRQLVRAADA